MLVPAALENVLTRQNARRVRARGVAEAANGPTTADAEAILRSRGVLVIPDIYLNSGGVTVSYFEWLKNLSHVRFGRIAKRFDELSSQRMVHAIESASDKRLGEKERVLLVRGADEEDLVLSGLEETMSAAFQQIRSVQAANPRIPDLRTAALALAIKKIAGCYIP